MLAASARQEPCLAPMGLSRPARNRTDLEGLCSTGLCSIPSCAIPASVSECLNQGQDGSEMFVRQLACRSGQFPKLGFTFDGRLIGWWVFQEHAEGDVESLAEKREGARLGLMRPTFQLAHSLRCKIDQLA